MQQRGKRGDSPIILCVGVASPSISLVVLGPQYKNSVKIFEGIQATKLVKVLEGKSYEEGL